MYIFFFFYFSICFNSILKYRTRKYELKIGRTAVKHTAVSNWELQLYTRTVKTFLKRSTNYVDSFTKLENPQNILKVTWFLYKTGKEAI